MSIVRTSPWRAALMAMMVFGCLLAPASAALAHNGTGGSSSDYRIQITGWQGDHTGIELRIVELGNRLELHRTTAQSVMISGIRASRTCVSTGPVCPRTSIRRRTTWISTVLRR
jgi:hypothetical protein